MALQAFAKNVAHAGLKGFKHDIQKFYSLKTVT